MAERLGVSIGWLSQVERDKSRPDAPAIEAIAGMLNVPTSVFIDTAPQSSEAGRVVRATTRRPIGSRVLGLTEELLSPDLTDDFEMVHSVFAPGAAITVPVTRATQEVAYLVSGKLDVTIAGETYKLGPGDSFRIRGEPYTWSNPYSSKCIAVWVIAPPVY